MSEVAIAMIECDGRWLLQLRDDIEGILYPGQWALFGGHLDPGETPEAALSRELEEEINWAGSDLAPWFELRDEQRIRHFFRGPLAVPFSSLTDTNMMFMIPMPPTNREMPPMAASIKVSPPVMVPTIERASFCERTAKSSSRRIRCRCLSRLVI